MIARIFGMEKKNRTIKFTNEFNNLINSSILLYLLCSFLARVNSQCCLQFQGELCISCPSNTHLYRGNCLLNRANCVEYGGGFDCISCRFGYVLDPNSSTCVPGDPGQPIIPMNGFNPIPYEQYSSDLVKKMLVTIKDNYKNISDLTIAKIFVRNIGQNPTNRIPPQNEERYYRMILLSSNGFMQVVLAYAPNTGQSTNQSNQLLTLLLRKNYQIGPGEEFANLDGDPLTDKVKQQIKTKFPQVSTLQILDSFRSLGTQITQGKISPVLVYRVFLLGPDTGIMQINITLPFIDMRQGQNLNISSLPTNLLTLLNQITQSQSVFQNFENTTLKSVTKIVSGVFQIYNATYQHTDIIVNGKPAESFFSFSLDTNSNRVVIGDILLYKFNPVNTVSNSASSNNASNATSTTTPPEKPPNTTTIALDNATRAENTTVRKIKIPTSKTPTMRQIGNDLAFEQYRDVLKFLRTTTFEAVRTFLQLSYPQTVLGNDVMRAAVAQNETMYIFDIVYRIYNPEETNTYCSFILIKQSYELELLRYFSMPKTNRTTISFNDNNRAVVMSTLDQNIKDIISLYIVNDPRYSPSALISQVLIVKFMENQSSTATQPKPVVMYIIKYYYPDELKKPYEYIEFRVNVVDGNVASRRKLGNILFPREQYVPVDPSDTVIQQSIDFYVSSNLLESDNVTYQKLYLLQSMSRPGVYRVALEFESKFDVIYEIDPNLVYESKMISNRTKNIPQIQTNTTNQTINANPKNTTNQNNSAVTTTAPVTDPSKTAASVTPIQIVINNFPQKNITPTAAPINNTKNYTDPTLLPQIQIKKIIADFLKIPIDTIATVKIIKRETLEKLLDTYTVQFATKTNTNIRNPNIVPSVPKTFIFQISSQPPTPTKVNKPGSLKLSKSPSSDNFFDYNGFNILDPFGLFTSWTSQVQQPKQTIFLNPFAIIDTSISILQSIFSLPFALLGIPISPPSNIANAAKNTEAIQKFVSQIPSIIPLRLTQSNKVISFSDLLLQAVQKPKTQATNVINKKITTPLIYDRNLATIQAQRQVGTDKKLSFLELQHVYYGKIGVLASITEQNIPDVQYLDKGYLLSLTDTGIVEKVPDVSSIQSVIASEISKILSVSNYTENKYSKKVSQKDIKCWRFKRITNVDQMQFTYEFDGFIVRTGILVGRKQENKTDEAKITKMKAIGNKGNRLKQQKAKSYSMRLITKKPQFRISERALWSQFGNYLYYGQIQDVKMENTSSQINFTVRYALPSGVIDTKLQYRIPSRKAYVLEIRSVNSSHPSLMPSGCKILSGAGLGMKCVQCIPTHYLNPKDGICYEKIKQCQLQSAQLCLSCNSGFILTQDFKCK